MSERIFKAFKRKNLKLLRNKPMGLTIIDNKTWKKVHRSKLTWETNTVIKEYKASGYTVYLLVNTTEDYITFTDVI